MKSNNSSWWANLKSLVKKAGLDQEIINEYSENTLQKRFKSIVMEQVSKYETLSVLPLPERWWTKAAYIEDAKWSRELTRFRLMNAGLGNRDADYKNSAVFVQHGRVVICPLCQKGNNNKIHLLVECEDMINKRNTVKLEETTLGNMINRIRKELNGASNKSITRYFLGQEKNLTRNQYMQRGRVLGEMIDRFMELWSIKAGIKLKRKLDDEERS